MSATTREAIVLQFPLPVRLPPNRLSLRDRIEALRWAEAARQFGYTRVMLDADPSQRAAEVGDFLLVYRGDGHWAAWGVGCVDDRYMLWRPSNGVTVGWFATLRAALDTIFVLS